jgi:excisionase family DNA binding protein
MNEIEALTVAEVCEKARLGRTSVVSAIKTGELRAVRYGRRVLVLPADLRKWLAALPAVKPTAHFLIRDQQSEGANMTSTREFEHKTVYDHTSSKKAGEEKRITTQSHVATLKAKHNTERSEFGRRRRAAMQKHDQYVDNERARTVNHHGGRVDADQEKKFEIDRRNLNDQYDRENVAMSARHEREMSAAKAKAAEAMV